MSTCAKRNSSPAARSRNAPLKIILSRIALPWPVRPIDAASARKHFLISPGFAFAPLRAPAQALNSVLRALDEFHIAPWSHQAQNDWTTVWGLSPPPRFDLLLVAGGHAGVGTLRRRILDPPVLGGVVVEDGGVRLLDVALGGDDGLDGRLGLDGGDGGVRVVRRNGRGGSDSGGEDGG